MEISDLVINIHRVVSTLFATLAIFLLVRSIRGWRLKKTYKAIDRNLTTILLVLLYIQMVAGLLLYFVLSIQRGGAGSMEAAAREMSIRSWALEHLIIMMFALFLSQLGWLFISRSKLDLNKYKNTLFYFGTSIILIILSIGYGLLSR